MLYDKRWDSKKNAKKDNAEVFSLAGLIAWLETKNPEEEYCYTDIGHCLIAQWLVDSGHPHASVGGFRLRLDRRNNDYIPIPENFTLIAQSMGRDDTRTFGAALSRARKIAESA